MRRGALRLVETGCRSSPWSSASVFGWGLVVDMFADDAAWNNWQGYLSPHQVGGGEGDWAYANLGVFFALVLLVPGDVVRAGRGRSGKQESA